MEITEGQRKFWEENSYLVMKGLFADRAEELSLWVNEVATWPCDDSKWLTNYEMDRPSQLARRENFVPFHLGLADIINGTGAITIASQLMGEPAQLYKERINFKYPGGGPHAAHQDGVAYEHYGKTKFDTSVRPYVSVLVSVDSATKENGCLEVVPSWPIAN